MGGGAASQISGVVLFWCFWDYAFEEILSEEMLLS